MDGNAQTIGTDLLWLNNNSYAIIQSIFIQIHWLHLFRLQVINCFELQIDVFEHKVNVLKLKIKVQNLNKKPISKM